jgi:hypothetical protein
MNLKYEYIFVKNTIEDRPQGGLRSVAAPLEERSAKNASLEERPASGRT